MTEHPVAAREEIEEDTEQQVGVHLRRWVALDSGELLMEGAA